MSLSSQSEQPEATGRSAGEAEATGRKGLNTPTKLDWLGLLVAGIVHNLYGPLTGILGTIDLLRIKHPEIAQDFDRISKLGRRMQREIKTMLHKAKIEATGEITTVDLVELIGEELEFFKADPRFKHEVQTVFSPPENLPTFKGPYGDFSQSLTNLLANALEAMDKVEEKMLTLALLHEGDEIVLSVEDNGIGMDTATLERAFEPFFTTKTPVPPGSKTPPVVAAGLGLTHVKNLLEPLGCVIKLESEPDKGTKVKVTIPYKRIDEASRREPAS